MAETAKVDPMHQFTIEPMFGTDHWQIAGYNIAFTNSSLWMAIAAVAVLIFVAGGMKRELVPGRWQMAVEGFTGFIDNLLAANIGPAGKKYVPYIFSLFIPHGTPLVMIPLIFAIELVSFLVRPFSLGLRLFVAMMAGHVLLEVLSGFVINGFNAGLGIGPVVSVLSFVLMIAICALEILVAGIQAYVFALLTSLYLNDAENLH